MRHHSAVFPYLRAAAVYPRRTSLDFMHKVGQSDLSKSVLASFAAAEMILVREFVRLAGGFDSVYDNKKHRQ